jgi:predicted RNA-binding protein YlxR (DUF448 family)
MNTTATRARKRPMRSCIACRTVRDKRELIRIVHTPDDAIRLDPTGKANGRGAYVCPDAACLRQAIKRKSLPRALKMELSQECIAELEREILAVVEQSS